MEIVEVSHPEWCRVGRGFASFCLLLWNPVTVESGYKSISSHAKRRNTFNSRIIILGRLSSCLESSYKAMSSGTESRKHM